MRVALSPQTREPDIAIANPVQDTCNGPMGSNGVMIWGCRRPIHGERAKPLDRVAAAAHFDCCVLCVMCVFVVVFCVWGQLLATKPVEIQHRPRQNGQFLPAHITKAANKHPKYCWYIAVDTLSTLGSLFLGSLSGYKPFSRFCLLGVGLDPRAASPLAWRRCTCYPQQSAGGRRPSCHSPA